jgi:hypothetical protein
VIGMSTAPSSSSLLAAAGPRERLDAIESEIVSLRGERRAPSEPPAPMPAHCSGRVLGLLAEAALHHAVLGEYEEARRAVGEAAPLFTEAPEGRRTARAALLVGEACLLLDAPQHAEPRLHFALTVFEELGDRPTATRALASLGRALVMLDDPRGIVMLETARATFAELGDQGAMIQAYAVRRSAEAALEGEPPRSIRTGYARPITVFPPRPSGEG